MAVQSHPRQIVFEILSQKYPPHIQKRGWRSGSRVGPEFKPPPKKKKERIIRGLGV
jgi:hypothetical protein